MKLPYTLHVDIDRENTSPLSRHKTLDNAKRAITARLNHWVKYMGGQAFCYAYKVVYQGKTVYSAGGWR